jgi:hypothetical protein
VLERESDEYMRELPEIPYLRAMVMCLNKIADLGATMADVAINRALEKPSKYVENVVRTVKHVRTVPLSATKRSMEK